MVGRTCPHCRQAKLEPIAKPGRRRPVRQLSDVEVPAHVAIPTCPHCGREYVDLATAKALDAAMVESYRPALASKARDALSRLKTQFNQWDIEPLLGLSAGYLSKIKSGASEPSATLVACLTMLANDFNRVDELRRSWSCLPDGPPRFTSCASNLIPLTPRQAEEAPRIAAANARLVPLPQVR